MAAGPSRGAFSGSRSVRAAEGSQPCSQWADAVKCNRAAHSARPGAPAPPARGAGPQCRRGPSNRRQRSSQREDLETLAESAHQGAQGHERNERCHAQRGRTARQKKTAGRTNRLPLPDEGPVLPGPTFPDEACAMNDSLERSVHRHPRSAHPTNGGTARPEGHPEVGGGQLRQARTRPPHQAGSFTRTPAAPRCAARRAPPRTPAAQTAPPPRRQGCGSSRAGARAHASPHSR